jgi:hypothetical protein
MSKIEFTADFFGRCYVVTLPKLAKSMKPKQIASTFYTPKTKGYYAFIKGMEKEIVNQTTFTGDRNESSY